MKGILCCGAIFVVLVLVENTVSLGRRDYVGDGQRGNHGYGSASARGKQGIDISMPMNYIKPLGYRHHINRGYGYDSNSGSPRYRSDSDSHSYGSDSGSHSHGSDSSSHNYGSDSSSHSYGSSSGSNSHQYAADTPVEAAPVASPV